MRPTRRPFSVTASGTTVTMSSTPFARRTSISSVSSGASLIARTTSCPVPDRNAIDGDDLVPHLESGALGRSAGEHLPDLRRELRLEACEADASR